MFANHDPATNLSRAVSAWGEDMPAWVRQLASACDRTSQRAVGEQIGYSSGVVSKILNRVYPGRYDEAETQVRAAFSDETVDCPEWGSVPLSSCIRNRRHKGAPRNLLQRRCAIVCRACPLNTDVEEA